MEARLETERMLCRIERFPIWRQEAASLHGSRDFCLLLFRPLRKALPLNLMELLTCFYPQHAEG